jgi:hypothetical protein
VPGEGIVNARSRGTQFACLALPICVPAARGAGRDDAEEAKIDQVIRMSIEVATTKDTVASFLDTLRPARKG